MYRFNTCTVGTQNVAAFNVFNEYCGFYFTVTEKKSDRSRPSQCVRTKVFRFKRVIMSII